MFDDLLQLTLKKFQVFSGVIPTHVQLEKSKAYLVARSLGANVTDRYFKQTFLFFNSSSVTFVNGITNPAVLFLVIRIASPFCWQRS